MTWHCMELSEPHSNKGFFVHYYTNVDVLLVASSWHWQQVGDNGNFNGPLSAPFASEDEAKDDALRKLGGNTWR